MVRRRKEDGEKGEDGENAFFLLIVLYIRRNRRWAYLDSATCLLSFYGALRLQKPSLGKSRQCNVFSFFFIVLYIYRNRLWEYLDSAVCLLSFLWCFTATETVRIIRDGEEWDRE